MTSPLDSGQEFQLTLRYPKPKASLRKDGMHYMVEFELPHEDWQPLADHLAGLGKEQKEAMVIEAICQVTHGPVVTTKINESKWTEIKPKPYGQEASLLYRGGFFNAPPVLEAIGTDDQFLAWIRLQPCARTGKRDYNKVEKTGQMYEKCVAAHVRDVASGSGTSIKPPYSAIPLVQVWHDAQSWFGHGALDPEFKMPPEKTSAITPKNEALGRDWMQSKREHYRNKWASLTLAESLGYESLGFVPPTVLVAWAITNDLIHIVPTKYREAV